MKIKNDGEKKPYVLLKDVCPQTPKMVVEGALLNDKRDTWVDVVNEEAPGGSFIRAGSTILLTEPQAKELNGFNAIVPSGSTAHFDLDTIFDFRVEYFGNTTTLAEVLRAHSITTLEMIVENSVGFRPLLDKKKGTIKAQEVLYLFGDKDKVAGWIEQAKKSIAS